jgi:RNA polymerase sigma-70 factor (ECF subfamily)
MPDDDQEWVDIALAKQGDVSSFNRLVERYQMRAYNLSLRLLRDHDEALDACQESFIKAWKKLRDFKGGSFKAWILKIVVNSCRDQQRKKKPTLPLDMDISSSATSVEEEVLQHELGQEILKGLSCLNFAERSAVTLFDIEGLSYQEVAEVMSCPLGTVKSRLSSGRRKLRDFLLKSELLPSRFRPIK